MNKRRIIPSLVLNSIIFILMIIGLILYFTIDHFDISILKYFTTISNILVGIASLIYSLYLIFILKNKRTNIPKPVEIIKLAATASVILTFLTVVLFLSFIIGDATMLFSNGNALYHVTIPLLALAT